MQKKPITSKNAPAPWMIIIVVVSVCIPWLAIGSLPALIIVAILNKAVPKFKDEPNSLRSFFIGVGIAVVIYGLVIGGLKLYTRNDGYYKVNEALYNKQGGSWLVWNGDDYEYCEAPIDSSEYDLYKVDKESVPENERLENSELYAANNVQQDKEEQQE